VTPARRERHRLEDILVSIRLIREYVAYRHDAAAEPTPAAIIGDAILYRFVILGEAAAGLSDETRAQMPEISWTDIVGMRNVVTHEYFQVDWEIVEATTERDLAAVEAMVKAHLGLPAT
jgi:uncharacterized protein with HEPN domain